VAAMTTNGAVRDETTRVQGLGEAIEHAAAGSGKGILKRMIAKSWMEVRTDYKVIMLTFELFWIAVFLLDRIGHATTGGVPQFVYVNF
jgi:hypothetical protein